MIRRIRFASALAAGLFALLGCTVEPEPPNLVLITVDTLRADHIGAYGYPRSTTPAIDRFAEGGIVFERAISQAQWTLPSMASLHTSLYPSEHGAVTGYSALPEDATTIAQVLQRSGYRTIAVVSHLFVAGRLGFARGFDQFDQLFRGHSATTSPGLSDRALEVLDSEEREPFFLWVHYFDPHFDYVRHRKIGFASGYPENFPEKIEINELRRRVRAGGRKAEVALDYARDVYDEEIRLTDLAIERLVGGIEGRDLARPTLFVLTADHGEGFREHGVIGHDRSVYQELIHVPLVFFGDVDPELRSTRVSGPVETRSLARTLARLAGEAGDAFGGQDLLERARGAVAAVPAVSEGSFAWGEHDHEVAVVGPRWKLIESRKHGTRELYDLGDDPGERTNRLAAGETGDVSVPAPLAERMAEHASRMELERSPAPRVDHSREIESQLRALGYLAPESEASDGAE